MQKRQHEKSCESKVAAQKWLWWSDNGKNFNNNISGEFWTVWLFLCRLYYSASYAYSGSDMAIAILADSWAGMI